MYSFKKKTKNLIKIFKDDKDVILELNTTCKSSIQNDHYIDVLLNDELIELMNTIQERSHNFLKKYSYLESQRFKSTINKDYMTIKIDTNALIKSKEGSRITKYCLEKNQTVKTILRLNYIWINEYMWGFIWKTNDISIIE